jgi:hypothetical protein
VEEEFSMPQIADYTVIQQGTVTLPKPDGDIDVNLPNFSAPAVAADRRSILSYVVNPAGDVTLELKLNGMIVSTETFNTEAKRVLQAVVNSNILQSANNTLIMKATGAGSVSFSDVVLTFQANI